MTWTRVDDPAGFSLERPDGWKVERHPAQAVMVTSPDGLALALIQHVPAPLPGTPAEVLQNGRFPTSGFFRGAQWNGEAAPAGGGAACTLRFPMPDGSPGQARLTCTPTADGGTILAYAAPQSAFAQWEPTLRYIVSSFRASAQWPGTAPRSTPPPGGMPPRSVMQSTLPEGTAPIFVPYTDPQKSTFTIQVPRGWQVRGGFNHAALGDRRPFVEVLSPDGMQVLYGDPDCPQVFYHTMMGIEGMMIPYPATGCVFLNLPPSAQKLAQYYVKHIAPRRFGQAQPVDTRDRKDIIDRAIASARQSGNPIPNGLELTAHEVRITAGDRVGACLGACGVLRGMNLFGMGTTWEGNVTVWLAPPHLVQMAETVAMRMIESFRMTPRLAEIAQQDEMMIANNGQVANLGQQQWFAAQQAGHQAQLGFGNAITSNYWQQQQTNDRMMQSYTNTQNTYDQVFQDGSDAMRGTQQMYDDGMGKRYEVQAGANYYWVDQQTGTVVGTDTDQPPDHQRNYTQLRKGQ